MGIAQEVTQTSDLEAWLRQKIREARLEYAEGLRAPLP